jgi:cytochrome c-type biogenesis protein CcmF
MGIVGSSVYDTETTATLAPGESTSINNYNIRYDGLEVSNAPGRDWIVVANVTIFKGDKEMGTLAPEKWREPVYGVVTESAIRSTLADDVWVTLESWDENDVATLRVLVNPLVLWIWIGGTVVVLGGIIAFWPERRSITAT